MAGAHWGLRLLHQLVTRLPAGARPIERRLLRSAYEVHRLVDAIQRPRDEPIADHEPTSPSDRDVWMLVHAVEALTATANEACAMGVDATYVDGLVAMTTVSAGAALEGLVRVVFGEDAAPWF